MVAITVAIEPRIEIPAMNEMGRVYLMGRTYACMHPIDVQKAYRNARVC
jgi:hypothetical protein